MKVAIFNGFHFHFEMFGYIIEYCKLKNHELTIFCSFNNSHLGWLSLYNSFFSDYQIEYKSKDEFINYSLEEKNAYDLFFLITDDDYSFCSTIPEINRKTICIDHYYKDRRSEFLNKLATRPFGGIYCRDWALPCFAIENQKNGLKYFHNMPELHIAIIGGWTDCTYNVSILHRIRFQGKIVIHAISKDMDHNKFQGIDFNKITELRIYKQIDTLYMLEVAKTCHFILTDATNDFIYEHDSMSGAIPMSFSLLIPLIISKKTNSYYQFKNVIEFEKHAHDEIVLHTIDFEALERERDELICHSFSMFDKYIRLM
uniref:Glycosyltransferase n=1 Tax=viral metagenome TaxID=1070528 RepID=A0A6C0JJC6_9ZZZZ